MKKPNPDRGEEKPSKKKKVTEMARAAAEELRHRAERRITKEMELREERQTLISEPDSRRLLHELQVHQIELEMQNEELQASRNHTEELLDKYIELYDFSPTGYFSLDEKGRILEMNLTGATLLGELRARLIGRTLAQFAEHPFRSVLPDLLAKVFAGSEKEIGEIRLKKKDGPVFWADLHACPAFSPDLSKKVCLVSISDITALKKAEDARLEVEILTHSNEKLNQEIVRRQAVEQALRKSEQHQIELLEQARELQKKLQDLSHRNLHTMEKVRKRISRDLHDDVVQTLVGINFHLVSLVDTSGITQEALKEKIGQTQQLVEESVQSILTFAHALRPPGLDDLGLVVSLNTLLEDFTRRTNMEVHFEPIDEVDLLSGDQRIALYRIVQTALSNVEEHSQATRVELRITQSSDTLEIQVSDNGIAFDVPEQDALRKGQHLGLISMRERTEMMGGSFEIESTPGKGTRLMIQIPLTHAGGGM